ncbi:MAG TPA: extradiol ring-cleavage dioxygenase [candidate division Zixibacteria bacterium]|nr:extradiol ring-cleavage dioxygenase [candidate division Zixibacteria bacterium]
MANLVGCMAMSHGPQLMLSPDHWGLLRLRESEGLPEKPGPAAETDAVKWSKWQGCMEAIARLRSELEALRPDVLVVVGDDQHENLTDDNMPPFSIYLGGEVEASTSLRYLNQPLSENRVRYRVDAGVARALLDGLMDAGFDPAYSRQTRYAGGLGHAFGRVLRFLLPKADCAIVPVMVNTYYPPAPSARRCLQFGRTLGSLLRRLPGKERVVVVGSGGLSHTLIDEDLDRRFLRAVERHDLDHMAAIPDSALVDGTSEIRNWIVTAGAAGQGGTVVDYLPLYRTRTGVGCAMGFAVWKSR